jgi:hypothetical protein
MPAKLSLAVGGFSRMMLSGIQFAAKVKRMKQIQKTFT